MSAYLTISRLTKIYATPKGPAVIVRDFDLEVNKGEFVCLIGHSGCGKTTVLSMLAGLNEVTSGVMVLAGKEIKGPGPDRGMVFQSPCLLPWLTALENVMLGVDQVYYTASRQERHDLAEYYLSLVGLADAMHKRPAELSQGMRQRVGIARAFALSPKMLLLDEPFGMLDSLTRFELQKVLLDLWRARSEDRLYGDPRRRRSDLSGRSRGHDDQWSRRRGRRHIGGAFSASARPKRDHGAS